jgi:pantoate kinase
VVSRATVGKSKGRSEVVTIVNGNPSYNARTTRRALALLAERYDLGLGRLELRQSVDVPIGSGFGASAASALSAVYAVASAFRVQASKSDLARCAHDAEIMEQTGLGTVSVTYDGTGAGAIVRPGIPGVARFLNVEVPEGLRIITASLAPFEKREAFSSSDLARKIVKLGDKALQRFLASPTIDDLATQGEWFSAELGLESNGVRRLIGSAKFAGASHASQNMIGHAVHALAYEGSADKVVRALRKTGLAPRIDVFEVGSIKAGPL